MEITNRWLNQSIKKFAETKPLYEKEQTLFPIVQGSVYHDLRTESAKIISDLDCEGNAIGGLSVGGAAEEMYQITGKGFAILSAAKTRYLIGVGTTGNNPSCN